MDKIAWGHSRETDIAQGKAKCYSILGLRSSLSAIFLYYTRGSALTGL